METRSDETVIAVNRMGFVAGMRISGTIFVIFVSLFICMVYAASASFRDAMLFTGLIWFAFALVLGKRITTWRTSRFYLTNRRVWAVSGLVSLKETIIPLDDIASVNHSQSPLGRWFRYGTLVINTKNGRKVKIRGISDISDFADKVEIAVETAQPLRNSP